MCEKVNEKTKEKKGRTGLLAAIVSVATGLVINYSNITDFLGDFYKWHNHPDLIYEEQEDKFLCEFQPKDAKLVLSPQLVIKHGDEIIRILCLDDMCNSRMLQYNKSEGGFVSGNMCWDDALEFAKSIKAEMKRKGYEVSFHKAYLMKMTYMKDKNHNQYEAYYIAENGLATNVDKEVIEKRGIAKKLIGDDWEYAFDEIISECMEILNNI